VKAGQVVKVKVLEVDVKRRRIGLTMKLNDTAVSGSSGGANRSDVARQKGHSTERGDCASSASPRQAPQGNTAFAEAFAKLKAKN